MPSLFRTLTGGGSARSDWPSISLEQYLTWLNVNGSIYGITGLNQTQTGKRQEDIDASFLGFVESAYKKNGIVFAAMAARMMLFSQARFQFQQLRNGQPGDLFGTPDLALLEKPWGPSSTTSDLLAQMLVYVDTAGNAFAARRSSTRLKVLRPDWVTIVMGSMSDPEVDAADIDAELLGYIYHPGGRNAGRTPVKLLPNQVAHFAPYPDPTASFRGMSWLAPIVREITADTAATSHKLSFFENAATPNLVVSLDKEIALEAFEDWVEAMEQEEPTGWDAYKTLYLGAGAKVDVVGKDLEQLDFKVVQGAGETRIAAASGIHPVILGLSEGLQGSSLNVGNFGAARRLTADKALWWLWGNVAGSLESIVTPPAGSRLWIDSRHMPFLRDDNKDLAEIQAQEAQTMRTLIDGGFEPASITAAVMAHDWSLLQHTGLYSVQLQPPNTNPDAAAAAASSAGRALAQLIAPHLAGTPQLTSGKD